MMVGKGRLPLAKNREKTADSHIILDPLLLPRLEQFAYNHSPLQLDSCIDYLRRNYREYSRKQQAPFRKLVLRAIHILQKRAAFRTPHRRTTELKLQQQEEAHSLRRREQTSSGEDDSTSSSVDHEDYSDGDDLEKGSFVSDAGIVEARSEEQEEGTHSAGSSERERAGFDKEQTCRKRKPDRASSKGRKKRKAEYGSDSAWEDEVLGASPAFNLLNSSLRSTYHGRPAVFIDAEATAEVQTPEAPSEVHAPGPKAQQAFAPSAVIAAAARAACKAGKKQGKQGEIAATTEKTPFIEGGISEVGNHATQDGITVTKRIEEPVKCGSDNQRPEEVKQAGKAAEIGDMSRQISKAERPGHKRRSKGSDKHDKEPSTTSAEAVRFSDLGGIDSVLDIMREMTFPLYNPGVYSWLGLQPIGGILLHGPPGCGKTKLANAIAYETGLPFLKISAPEVVSGMSGESEAKVRGLFTEASRLAPCIVFIDEIDAITSKRESANREMERRIVTQLMTCMDELSQPFQKSNSISGAPTMGCKGHVLVIGATNRPEALDPALRRPGRFDREVSLAIPDENGRAQILSVLAKNLRLEGSFDFKHIAKCTPGFVGADLAALTREAGSIAIKRIVSSRDPHPAPSLNSGSTNSMLDEGDYEGQIFKSSVDSKEDGIVESVKNADSWWKVPWTKEEMHALSISMQDFEVALQVVQPSTKREGFSAIPDVKWEDVGALDSVRKDMEFFISRRIKHPEDYEALGLDMDTGFLLYGPPGCGKTLVAKAVANDAQANFISIKGPELLNKYVGESELAVRALFSRARSCAPCIIFFDEMDALAPRRGTDGNAVAERVLNQLLSEMDGAEKRKGVFMIGATNRPDMIDPAILRPGRLGKLLFVPLPDSEGRLSILKTLIRRKPISSDVNLVSIATNKSCEGLSGADLAALVNESCVAALQEKSASCRAARYSKQDEPILVSARHFDMAQSQISPSVSKQDLLYYEALPRKFNRTSGLKGVPSETFL